MQLYLVGDRELIVGDVEVRVDGASGDVRDGEWVGGGKEAESGTVMSDTGLPGAEGLALKVVLRS